MLIIDYTSKTAFTSPTIMFYVSVFIIYIMILLTQAIQELAIPINSCTKITTTLICNSLLGNTFVTMIHTSVAKDSDLRNKEFFGFYWFSIKNDQISSLILSLVYPQSKKQIQSVTFQIVCLKNAITLLPARKLMLKDQQTSLCTICRNFTTFLD